MDVGHIQHIQGASRQLADFGWLRSDLILRILIATVLAGQNLVGDQAGILPDRGLDAGGHVRIGAQKGLGVFAALADALAVMENQAPDFSTIPALTPRSMISPILEIPSPYMMSNSTCLNGGASLFFTTFTRVWLPTTSSRSLMVPMRRMSRRIDA